ncbi:GlxA family transcriptional regulator [Kineobactrum salinum]|uniref:Helix-turn-helix domain-containing protein n=1 Tax=Kineobactrum salinum TaxID=2708301 RepID=A0A6C0U7X5_9GAMM|nr:helix-turn-helix domain-containing protein [Kineobactrum salinum]QIB67097.1 helix-turn-helix domain-containing protein [Kineobactrum salinum]
MYTAAALVYPDALATSLTLPMEILRAASQMARGENRHAAQASFVLAGPGCGPLTLASGLTLHTTVARDALPPLDLLLLPAIWRNPAATLGECRDWLGTLRSIAAAGTRICSVGTASCLLAEAGLLDGRPATTHWNYFEHFARRYPQVKLKTRHLITQSDNIYCVGSVNSIADLTVHIVEGWFGSRIARAIEHQFSPEIRQPFRSAAWQDQPRAAHHDETVLQAQQWLQTHVGHPVSLAAMAPALGISARSLNRRFRQATGMTPQHYLNTLRINSARELLRRSNLSISEVAWQLGLQDASYFSRLFRRLNGMTPMKYRAAVRGKLFDPQQADTSH